MIAGRASGYSQNTARPCLFLFFPFALGLSGSISATFLEYWGFPVLCLEELEALSCSQGNGKAGKAPLNGSETGHQGLGVAWEEVDSL